MQVNIEELNVTKIKILLIFSTIIAEIDLLFFSKFSYSNS